MPFGWPGRKRVAGHVVAVLQRALDLVVQRRAKIFDCVGEVQSGGERLQIGGLVSQRSRWRRHHELREVEQRTGMRWANWPRGTEATPVGSLQARRRRECCLASCAIAGDESVELGVRDRDG